MLSQLQEIKCLYPDAGVTDSASVPSSEQSHSHTDYRLLNRVLDTTDRTEVTRQPDPSIAVNTVVDIVFNSVSLFNAQTFTTTNKS